jgi:pimeloyl-ACP methyl ester carboxylesterase
MPFAAVNGLNMYYEMHGEGPPLLLLHGGTDTMGYFAPVIPLLVPHFRLIAVEQMGHGRTGDHPGRDFHYHDMAEDTLALMQQLGIGKASVIGFSDGGIIALDMAIHHPGKVVKLVLTGANSRVEGYDPAARSWLTSLGPDDLPMSDIYSRMSPDGPGHWPAVLARIQKMWASEPAYNSDQLHGIAAPCLLIVGDRDFVTVEHATEMFRTMPRAQLCVVPDGGHGVLPPEAVLKFLR